MHNRFRESITQSYVFNTSKACILGEPISMLIRVFAQRTPFITLILWSPVANLCCCITTSHLISSHTNKIIVLFHSLHSLDEYTQGQSFVGKGIGKTSYPFWSSLPLNMSVVIIYLAIIITVCQLYVTSFSYRVPILMQSCSYFIFLPDTHHIIIIDYTYRLAYEPTVT